MLQQKMPPVHPGEILKEMYLDPLVISITSLADNLGVARKTLSQLVNGHTPGKVDSTDLQETWRFDDAGKRAAEIAALFISVDLL